VPQAIRGVAAFAGRFFARQQLVALAAQRLLERIRLTPADAGRRRQMRASCVDS
jgi:hypothetical protein